VAFGRTGFGYLRTRVEGWNRAAQGCPFLLLTDLDQGACPATLIAEWLKQPRHPNLLFRVAVREIEAWLLADATNFAAFTQVDAGRIPPEPESLPDPKATLAELVRRSKSRLIRGDIVPSPGSTAKQGPGYNGTLGEFVRERWSPEAAAARAPSLARTMRRLQEFEPLWPGN
jgi:hypothetical protein